MNPQEKPLWKKLVSIGILLIGLVFVMQSAVSLYNLARRGDVVGEERENLKRLEKDQEELKKSISQSYTPLFIEEEARNKLGLVKPGETLVYLEKDASNSGDRSLEVGDRRQESGEERKTALQQWWDVFF